MCSQRASKTLGMTVQLWQTASTLNVPLAESINTVHSYFQISQLKFNMHLPTWHCSMLLFILNKASLPYLSQCKRKGECIFINSVYCIRKHTYIKWDQFRSGHTALPTTYNLNSADKGTTKSNTQPWSNSWQTNKSTF